MDNTKKFNCFVYAFCLDNDPDFIFFGRVPPNLPPKYQIDHGTISYLIERKVLNPTNTPTSGDYIAYRRLNSDACNHMGIMRGNGMVTSKWGTEQPIRTHKIDAAFSTYGENISYYRKVSADEIKRAIYSHGFR